MGDGKGDSVGVLAVFRFWRIELDGPLLNLKELESDPFRCFSRNMTGSKDDTVCKA